MINNIPNFGVLFNLEGVDIYDRSSLEFIISEQNVPCGLNNYKIPESV